MPTTVWMADWQMDCCGTPFAVGSEISWHLRPPTDVAWLATIVATRIDAVEDHHGDTSSPPTTATVISIATVHCRFDPAPVADSGVVTPVTSAGKWNGDRGDRRFAGFLIRLRTAG